MRMYQHFKNFFEEVLQPETDMERRLLRDSDFCEGLRWGQPRFGHPEGSIYKHIQEVLRNIDALGVEGLTRKRLRLVAFAHDTFKHKEKRSYPRDWSKHHGMLARRFMQRYTQDEAVLDLLELHDEAFYAWRTKFLYGNPAAGELRLQRLLERMGEHRQLFYLFFKCDTQTGDKHQEPLKWFEEKVEGIELVPDLV